MSLSKYAYQEGVGLPRSLGSSSSIRPYRSSQFCEALYVVSMLPGVPTR